MRPQAELGVAKPLRAGIFVKRLIFYLKGPRLNVDVGIGGGRSRREHRRASKL
jgi:hypothetical protein